MSDRMQDKVDATIMAQVDETPYTVTEVQEIEKRIVGLYTQGVDIPLGLKTVLRMIGTLRSRENALAEQLIACKRDNDRLLAIMVGEDKVASEKVASEKVAAQWDTHGRG